VQSVLDGLAEGSGTFFSFKVNVAQSANRRNELCHLQSGRSLRRSPIIPGASYRVFWRRRMKAYGIGILEKL
jgi:hypothetical protein